MSDPGLLSALDPARVERALQKLPRIEREVLLLRSREGLGYAEIAALLGVTPALAEARYASGLVNLHRRLMPPRPLWRRLWRAGSDESSRKE